MKVSQITTYQYSIPLKKKLTTNVKSARREGLILCFKDDQGHEAFGEVAPLPGFHQENLQNVLSQFTDCKTLLTAEEFPEELEPLLNGGIFRELSPSLSFGIQMALIYLLASRSQLRTPALLGEPFVKTFPVTALLTGPEEEILEDANDYLRRGFRSFKLKVGRGQIENEIKLIRKLVKLLGSRSSLRLDANQLWSFDQAVKAMKGFSPEIIEFIEEPLSKPSPEKLEKFYRETGIPYGLDESLPTFGEEALQEMTGLKTLVLKPTYMGIKKTIDWITFAKKEFLTGIISGTFESGVGLSFLGSVASALMQPEVGQGLGTYMWLEEDILKNKLPIQEGILDVIQSDIERKYLCMEKLTPVYPEIQTKLLS